MEDIEVLLTKLGVAVLCSFVLGLERQLMGKPVGVRTSIMVCIGTVLYCHMALELSTDPADHVRLLGQIVTGIGFLGAGVMLANNGRVMGVTSAAVIWLLAAIGTGIGFGYFALSFVVTLFGAVALVGIAKSETMVSAMRRGVHSQKKQKDS